MSQRCQHSGPKGQCNHQTVDGSEFCLRHSDESARLRGYYLSDTGLRERFDHMAGSECLGTVRDEVILLRALINERLDLARTEADKIVAFQTIHPALSTLNKLVESLSKLELQTDVVLAKTALTELSDDIVTILIEELSALPNYTDIVDRVAQRISDKIAESRN